MTLECAEILQITKICKKCGINKPISEFHQNLRNEDKKDIVCRICIRASKVAWEAKNPGSMKKARKKWEDNNRDKLNAARREYYSRPEVKEHRRAIVKKKKAEGTYKFYYIKFKYGLTRLDFENLLKSQDHKCAICFNEITWGDRKTHIDHCHTTGKIRGILCEQCNKGLGCFKDNENALRNAINYLLKSRMV